MRWFDRSIQRLGFGIAVLALALQVHATVAQQAPARAPEITTENEGGDKREGAFRRALPDEAARARRAAMMQNALVMGRGTNIPIVVEGDYVYVLYGTHLLQFHVDGLKLAAEVDLRDIVGPDRAARRAERADRGRRRQRDADTGELPRPRDADAPAAPAEKADTPVPGTDRDAPAEADEP